MNLRPQFENLNLFKALNVFQIAEKGNAFGIDHVEASLVFTKPF